MKLAKKKFKKVGVQVFFFRQTLIRYFRYYHNFRTHLSLEKEKDAPTPRAIQIADLGPVVEVSEVGGLHRHYERRAA